MKSPALLVEQKRKTDKTMAIGKQAKKMKRETV